MCFDKRVIAILAAVAVAIFAIKPSWLVAGFPLLLVALCPISMVAMMRTRSGSAPKCEAPEPDKDVERLRTEVAGLRAELAARNGPSTSDR